MRNFVRLSSVFLIIIGVFISCQKENFVDHVGPSICASANFKYVQQPVLSASVINLNVDTLKVSAVFNESIPWKVKITGQTSKSFKNYSGYGSSLNVKWLGNPDTLTFFQAGEQCEVAVTIACKEVIKKTFTISTVNSFTNFNYLVYNGDGGGLASGPFAYGTYAVNAATSGLNSPQGGDCFCTTGNSGSLPVWFFGGYDLPVVLGTSVKLDPENVYINCFVNVQGSSTTVPVITLKEGLVQRSKTLSLSGNGWHYVTYKLSDFNVVNPRNINTVIFGLNAFPNQSTSGKMCVDFVSFTNDSPFISTSVK